MGTGTVDGVGNARATADASLDRLATGAGRWAARNLAERGRLLLATHRAVADDAQIAFDQMLVDVVPAIIVAGGAARFAHCLAQIDILAIARDCLGHRVRRTGLDQPAVHAVLNQA